MIIVRHGNRTGQRRVLPPQFPIPQHIPVPILYTWRVKICHLILVPSGIGYPCSSPVLDSDL